MKPKPVDAVRGLLKTPTRPCRTRSRRWWPWMRRKKGGGRRAIDDAAGPGPARLLPQGHQASLPGHVEREPADVLPVRLRLVVKRLEHWTHAMTSNFSADP